MSVDTPYNRHEELFLDVCGCRDVAPDQCQHVSKDSFIAYFALPRSNEPLSYRAHVVVSAASNLRFDTSVLRHKSLLDDTAVYPKEPEPAVFFDEGAGPS